MICAELEKAGLTLDAQACARLGRYAQLLLEWNATHNLSGAKSLREIEENLLDSLYPLNFVDRPKSLLDVGSGAGFPGLALAIAWPETQTLLCEPRNKRAAFLRYAALELELPGVSVAKKRVEELEHAPFDLLTSRAVSDTALLLELTQRLADEKRCYLFYKGSRVLEELESLPSRLQHRIVRRGQRQYLYLMSGTERLSSSEE